jgi:predicted  nucleic acid-binding Zn-ribbon protein
LLSSPPSRTSAPIRGTIRHRAHRLETKFEEHILKADPFAQLKLLDLQVVDSGLDRLDHQLKHLPEHAALTALSERKTDVSARLGRAETEVSDLEREQRKADADVEQVKTRRERNQQRIDGGTVGDPKQLQAMQHEIVALDKRISDLEDEELVVMERLEAAQQERDRLSAELAEINQDGAKQLAARDAAASEISRQQEQDRAERDKLSADIPADLLALYERLRSQLGGVGVGALHQKRCGGCQLNVGASDLARFAVAPSDEVLRCEECNRILVRTDESGL